MYSEDESLVYIAWIPVDSDGNEITLPEEEYMGGGGVKSLPVVNDYVYLNHSLWKVVKRVWGIPIPHLAARSPRQMCTLHVIKEDENK